VDISQLFGNSGLGLEIMVSPGIIVKGMPDGDSIGMRISD
jgi:hypothetical protein